MKWKKFYYKSKRKTLFFLAFYSCSTKKMKNLINIFVKEFFFILKKKNDFT